MPTEETKAGCQEEGDGDRAATQLQNLNFNSAILDFEVRCTKIKSKLSRLVEACDGMLDDGREKALSSLHLHLIRDITEFFQACHECG